MSSQPFTPKVHLTRLSSNAETSNLQAKLRDTLTSKVKIFPSELLWDDLGLTKFEAFRTLTSDYYPARNETQILIKYADIISQSIPMKASIIELGSGNIEKTTLLLSALQKQEKTIDYYALDMSSDELSTSVHTLDIKFQQRGGISCHGLLGTYDDLVLWLHKQQHGVVSPVIFLWLGNSIGNYCSRDAAALLTRIVSSEMTCELRFIIGVDGCQNISQIERCYDAKNPLMQAFLTNGLRHANRLAEMSLFRDEDWVCTGCYESTESTWKYFYVAQEDLEMDLLGTSIKFVKDERMLAISSAKWTEYDIASIVRKAGLVVRNAWKDTDDIYGVYLVCQNPSGKL